jgi:hypothetical protein
LRSSVGHDDDAVMAGNIKWVRLIELQVDGKQIYDRTEGFHLDRIVGAIEERI